MPVGRVELRLGLLELLALLRELTGRRLELAVELAELPVELVELAGRRLELLLALAELLAQLRGRVLVLGELRREGVALVLGPARALARGGELGLELLDAGAELVGLGLELGRERAAGLVGLGEAGVELLGLLLRDLEPGLEPLLALADRVGVAVGGLGLLLRRDDLLFELQGLGLGLADLGLELAVAVLGVEDRPLLALELVAEAEQLAFFFVELGLEAQDLAAGREVGG